MKAPLCGAFFPPYRQSSASPPPSLSSYVFPWVLGGQNFCSFDVQSIDLCAVCKQIYTIPVGLKFHQSSVIRKKYFKRLLKGWSRKEGWKTLVLTSLPMWERDMPNSVCPVCPSSCSQIPTLFLPSSCYSYNGQHHCQWLSTLLGSSLMSGKLPTLTPHLYKPASLCSHHLSHVCLLSSLQPPGLVISHLDRSNSPLNSSHPLPTPTHLSLSLGRMF